MFIRICNFFCSRLGNFDDTVYANFNMTNVTSGSGLTKYTNDFFDQSLTWQDVSWLKNVTTLPVVLKGIITGKKQLFKSVNTKQRAYGSSSGMYYRQIEWIPYTMIIAKCAHSCTLQQIVEEKFVEKGSTMIVNLIE